jgi:hypothetical protein
VVINLVKALVFGRSRLESTKIQSTIGASINTDTSAGSIRTSCCNSASAGILCYYLLLCSSLQPGLAFTFKGEVV